MYARLPPSLISSSGCARTMLMVARMFCPCSLASLSPRPRSVLHHLLVLHAAPASHPRGLASFLDTVEIALPPRTADEAGTRR